jgi:hypothetical protein
MAAMAGTSLGYPSIAKEKKGEDKKESAGSSEGGGAGAASLSPAAA